MPNTWRRAKKCACRVADVRISQKVTVGIIHNVPVWCIDGAAVSYRGVPTQEGGHEGGVANYFAARNASRAQTAGERVRILVLGFHVKTLATNDDVTTAVFIMAKSRY